MSQFATDVPEVLVKPGKMLHYWSTKMKVGAVLLALAVYVYFLMCIKNIYLKSQKIEGLKAMVGETEKMMHNLHVVDANLALNIKRLDAMHNAEYASDVAKVTGRLTQQAAAPTSVR